MTMISYDDIPYPSLVHTDTQPSRLATLATLFGLQPPPVTTCRVLELGCGDGTNLIAIAQSLPQAKCVGIDSSANQISKGQQRIETLNLLNINLKRLQFDEVDEALGKFDYIIAHGVYSWVPIKLQDKVLSLCKHHLASNGIVYISYNAYPGWHQENVIREMMVYHVQQLPQLPFQAIVQQAKGIVQFLANLRHQGQSAFDILLQEKSKLLQAVDGNYLCHDFLEKDNHPVYFLQFIQHAAQHGLNYVTDIEFRNYLMSFFPSQVVEALEELFQEDFLRQEQYMDFFYNRTLRRNLLCHQDLVVNRELHWEFLTECYLAAFLQTSEDNPNAFKTLTGETIPVTHPLIEMAILYLSKIYPQPVLFEELFKYACQQIPSIHHPDLAKLRETFARELLHLYCLEAIELNIHPPAFTTTLSTYPEASPLARWQAAQGLQPLINLRCEFIQLNPFCVALLPYLNGQNDKAALLTILTRIANRMKIELSNQKVDFQVILEETLLEVAGGALLVA